MSVPIPQPTPYQDVNIVLNLMLSNLQAILRDHFIGLYLGGSLALGDFNPHRSDIDFVAVTVGELPPEMIVALAQMHTGLWATGAHWARKLDGSCVPQQIFRHWAADHPPCPFVEGDRFTLTTEGSALIQRHIIHQYGGGWSGPMPMFLAWREPDHIPWPNLLDWPTPSLRQAAPGRDDQGLA